MYAVSRKFSFFVTTIVSLLIDLKLYNRINQIKILSKVDKTSPNLAMMVLLKMVLAKIDGF